MIPQSFKQPLQKIRTVAVGIGLIWVTTSDAVACVACFGAKDDPVVNAVGWAILFLLGVVAMVVGGAAALFISIARRTRKYQQQLQEGTDEWIEVPSQTGM
ncbi:MAG: hypothetical protein ACFCUX_07020 [Candidatus Methylacidiphilales bacterium]